MKTFAIVTGFIRKNGQVLMLKRSHNRTFYPSKWEPVSGAFQEQEPAEDAVLRETKEETGLSAKILKTAQVYEVDGEESTWIVKPFLLESNDTNVQLSEEHSDFRWIEPALVLAELDCVDGIDEDLKRLALIESERAA